jgi:integrase/recombinase XerD
MFETLIIYPAVLKRHREGPLARERATYLENLASQGMARETLLWRARCSLCVARKLEGWPAGHRFAEAERDHALLLFLYNTGARASEAAEVTLDAITLDPPGQVRLLGKGRKIRTCPLWPHTCKVLCQLLGTRLDGPSDVPVFRNVRNRPLTRFGIHTLVARTVVKVAKTMLSLREKRVSPHTIRHTTAVHLLRAGVDINTIRAWLGHVSLDTTNRYAEVDLEMKAKALEKCVVSSSDSERKPTWRKDKELMAFLSSL